ncbi:MAG: methyl-accepting chemotaxis protein [Betaproteobacteria bacterium]|nr:methyl-accepting chemotaxis protein [Betaproteobacteria bacterium]
MVKIRNITIRGRLVGMLAFASLALIAVGSGGLWGMRLSHQGLETVYKDRVITLERLARIDRLNMSNRLLLDQSILSPDATQIKWNLEEMTRNIDETAKLWAEILKTRLTYEEKTLALQLTSDRQALVENGLRPAAAALRDNKLDEAIATVTFEVHTLHTPVAEGLKKLIELQTKVAKKEYEGSDALNLKLQLIGIVAMALGVAVFTVVGTLLLRAIVVPLDRAVGIAAQVANGELDKQIEVGRRDEIGRLLGELNTMSGSLRSLVREVRDGSGAVATAATEIARGNADLSSRTEQQASTLEETASSMEELAATVKQNADHAKQANELAVGASGIAERGGKMMSQVVDTMTGISVASSKISEIIGVIDGIAFQTNILALNAAVEAARAGEQGRGFAVVASEVRALAQRSAEAAKEIKGLIQNSTNRVGEGAKLVELTRGTMVEIVTAVRHVNEVISEISAASQGQLAGIEQVSRAVTQMDHVVQQNAALVEESAAAAENQSLQASALVKAVARFRLGDEEAFSEARSSAQMPAAESATANHSIRDTLSEAAHGATRLPAKGESVRVPIPSSLALGGPESEWKTF